MLCSKHDIITLVGENNESSDNTNDYSQSVSRSVGRLVGWLVDWLVGRLVSTTKDCCCLLGLV